MERTVRNIAWFAGLLEGEGSFSYGRGRTPRLDVQMTDRDIVQRCAEFMGVKIPEKSWQSKKHPHYKPLWRCTICGGRAMGWMMTIYLFMGERRKKQIKEIFEVWIKRREPRKQRMAPCHPNRVHRARGFCSSCYQTYRRRLKKGLVQAIT